MCVLTGFFKGLWQMCLTTFDKFYRKLLRIVGRKASFVLIQCAIYVVDFNILKKKEKAIEEFILMPEIAQI